MKPQLAHAYANVQPIAPRPAKKMPRSRYWLIQMFRGKSEVEVMLDHLHEARAARHQAKLALLLSHTNREHATCVIAYRDKQIKRIERELEAS